MTKRSTVIFVLGLTLVACDRTAEVGSLPDAASAPDGVPSDGMGTDMGIIDGASTDFEPCNLTCNQAPSSTCISANTLRSYKTPGQCVSNGCAYDVQERDCGSLGCCIDHCCELTPSNATHVGTLENSGLVLTLPSMILFDTDNDCTTSSVLGDCSLVINENENISLCVCRSDEITINTLDVVGMSALAIMASQKVTIQGVIDISAMQTIDGPGASFMYPDKQSGIAGGSGGSFGTKGGSGGGNGFKTRTQLLFHLQTGIPVNQKIVDKQDDDYSYNKNKRNFELKTKGAFHIGLAHLNE